MDMDPLKITWFAKALICPLLFFCFSRDRYVRSKCNRVQDEEELRLRREGRQAVPRRDWPEDECP